MDTVAELRRLAARARALEERTREEARVVSGLDRVRWESASALLFRVRLDERVAGLVALAAQVERVAAECDALARAVAEVRGE